MVGALTPAVQPPKSSPAWAKPITTITIPIAQTAVTSLPITQPIKRPLLPQSRSTSSASMRLINAKTLRFQDFFGGDMPPYAIPSHTWETDEVTFQDMASPYLPPKSGYTKITETCRLALEMDIEHAWVDSCCIDKSSSAELTESINSMFQWYENAAVCYVYLADLHPGTEFRDGIDRCRWTNRGWTLQELIAPRNVYFYDRA
jgi:hypothetical protein